MDIVLTILAMILAVVIIYFAVSKSDAEESAESEQVETPKRTTTKPPKSFSKMTKKELLAYAEENGIDANSRDTKAEIVKKIKSEF